MSDFDTRIRAGQARRELEALRPAPRSGYRGIALAVASVTLALTANGLWTSNVDSDTGQPVHAVQCQEDQSCWDCHTMGNKRCGR